MHVLRVLRGLVLSLVLILRRETNNKIIPYETKYLRRKGPLKSRETNYLGGSAGIYPDMDKRNGGSRFNARGRSLLSFNNDEKENLEDDGSVREHFPNLRGLSNGLQIPNRSLVCSIA